MPGEGGGSAHVPLEVHVGDPGQMTVDMAGGGQSLGSPASSIRNHAHVRRGLGYVPESSLPFGLYGRMFRRLAPYIPDDARIDTIVRLMREPSGAALDGKIPAGYTYLGQFIDHDLTFDPTSSLQRRNDPDALVNFRTPRFDLDSVYGRGPADQPYLYEMAHGAEGHRFVIGKAKGEARGELDLPRDSRGVALIGDPRNDENVIVSQLQLTFMLFHNKVCEWLTADDAAAYEAHRSAGEGIFDCAQRLVRWHYQWIVVHDFLKRIVDATTYKDVLRHESLIPQGEAVEQVTLRFFAWRHQIFMPVEFAVAAYRFGHSMVRPAYTLNSRVGPLPIFAPESVRHLGGFRRLPVNWQVEWSRFFHLGDSADLQHARRIDRYLAPPLLDLPPELAGAASADLARRNLTRGARLGLPSGQQVALAIGAEPLDDEDLDLPGKGPAPLWYYVLREAELHNSGRTLGTVGSRIVSEVFLGMLSADPFSYLSAAPGWKPVLCSAKPGEFTMADLINFTGFGVAAQPSPR
ncbi:heme peroxidase family protein [Micromonospora sp. DR5-3]|uniref:peroxidase family protein n=1 Tax=unclassified Micromonospora TaxID=2617518 RepID=UPI0011D55E35|nr:MULTISPECIES: heme peroxidase family protein [unclassified Micromonospora]MCW3815820.1 heme peroxidase family protein [Micromonospora sp. DR5-3]TYC21196.1 peroxidase [Micromonospora sp. MP36]